jgi:MFS family permease
MTLNNRHTAFFLLFCVMVLVGISNSMLFVVLPVLTRQLGAGEMYLGLIFAGSAGLYMFFSPFWGWRSDVSGRRPVLLFGILGNGASLLSMGLVSAWIGHGAATAGVALVFLALSRVIYGTIGSSMQPAAQAYIADRTERAERTAQLSLLAAGAGLGTAMGPPIAAWLSSGFGVPNAMYFLVGLSVLLFAIVSIGLPEHQRPERQTVSGREMLAMTVDSRVRSLLVIGTLSWMAHGVFLQTLLFYVSDRLHLASEQALVVSGIILALGAVGVLFVQFGIIPALKPNPRQLMISGALFAGAGAAMMIIAESRLGIGFAFVLASSGLGLLRPGMASAASLRVNEHEQGGAAGLVTATAGAGFMIAPFTGLALYQFVAPAAAYALLVCAFVLVLFFSLRQPVDVEQS